MASYGYRVRKAEWGASANTNFVAELLITGVDTGVGVIERLSTRLSEMGLNIRAFSIEGNEGYFEGHVKLMVANKDQLTLALRALKTLDGVANVVRVEN
jgi:GTP pyrophosphokinase